jgi:hypothetical protein
MMVDTKKLKIVDNASIGEQYANKLVSASFDGAAVIITLGTSRFVADQNAKSGTEATLQPIHVTARLAISPAGAVELANALNAMLKTLNQMQQKALAARAAQPSAVKSGQPIESDLH